MKSKIILLCVLFVGIMSISTIVEAQPAIINDIVIDTQDSSVKLTITSSQTLQIETFKNDESPANYIVLDFIGSVYTNMPSIIDVGKGAVEKVSLVRGEESQISIDGEPYYSLDFLAINLTSAADYRVDQSQSVIDLSIGAEDVPQEVKSIAKVLPDAPETTVDLSPPIVVSRKQKTVETIAEPVAAKTAEPVAAKTAEPVAAKTAEPVAKSYDYIGYDANNYKAKHQDSVSEIETTSVVADKIHKKEPPVVEKREKTRQERRAMLSAKRTARAKQKRLNKKRRRGGFLFFGRRSKTKKPEKVVQEETAPVVKKIAAVPTKTERENYLIDSIVNETIREKQKTLDRIEDLTMELKNLQQALSLSKGQKSQLDEKINEILAKLDQLKSALDEEIRRRQALGEKVDDLIAQRNAYIKAKKDYEDFKMQLNRVSASVEDLNAEIKKVSSNLDIVRSEKRKLEDDVNAMETEYTQVKTEYDNTVRIKDAINLTIEKLNQEIDELRQKLDKTVAEKSRIVVDLKNFENQSKYSGAELARLKQLLLDKNAVLVDLSKRFDQLRSSLDLAVSEKFKVEYSYRTAKTEFERIKSEIEAYLQRK